MTPKEHKSRHKRLHEALDELFADYITHHPKQSQFLQMPVQQLLEWSHEQSQTPTDTPKC